MSSQPVILVVDDDMTSLTITEQEMRKRYGRDYRVLARQSATAALDELRRLKADGPAGRPDPRRPGDAGDAGHRLPRRGARASTRSPSASCSSRGATGARRRRSSTGCAVGQIEFFITKPWHTAPDERFHREVAGFLYEWARLQRPVYEAVRLVGERWAPRSHELRDLLGTERRRLRVLRRRLRRGPGDPAGRRPRRGAPAAGRRRLRRPHPRRPEQPRGRGVARRAQPAVRRRVRPAHRRRGAGRPRRRRLRLVGGPQHGGARARGPRRPGRAEHHDPQLPRLPRRHLRRRAHVPRLRAGVAVRGRVPVLQRGRLAAGRRRARTSSSSPTARRCGPAPSSSPWASRTGGWRCPASTRSAARACSTGRSRPRRGRCVDMDVYVVGGGNSAGQAAIHLAKYARHVTLVTRGDGLSDTMSRYLVSFLENADRISMRPRTLVVNGDGDTRLRQLTLEQVDSGDREVVPADALFVMIGADPHTGWLPPEIGARRQRVRADRAGHRRRRSAAAVAAGAAAARPRDQPARRVRRRRRARGLGQASSLRGRRGRRRRAARAAAPGGQPASRRSPDRRPRGRRAASVAAFSPSAAPGSRTRIRSAFLLLIQE